MSIRLREALTKHLNLFWEVYEKDPVIYFYDENNIDLFCITDTLSFCEKNGEPYHEHEKEGACICIKIDKKGTSAKISAIGIDFIDVETKDAFIFGYPFSDKEKGIEKCLDVLKTVYGVTSENQIKIRTEVGKRIFRTESLLKKELQNEAVSRKPANHAVDSPKPTPTIKKKTTLGQKFAIFAWSCVILFMAYMFGRDIIYYPLKTSKGSYELKEDGSIDISNFREWDKSGFEEKLLPEIQAVYVWCLDKNCSLPQGELSDDKEFKTVTYNGEKLRVLYVNYTSNLNLDVREACMGSEYRGNTMNNSLGKLMGYGLSHSKSRSMKIVEDAKIPIAKYIQNNLRLFYWEYYSDLFRGNNIRYETQDLINNLKPPFNTGI